MSETRNKRRAEIKVGIPDRFSSIFCFSAGESTKRCGPRVATASLQPSKRETSMPPQQPKVKKWNIVRKSVSVEANNDMREKRSSAKLVLQIEHASRKNGKHRTGGRMCRLSKILSNFWCRIQPLLLSCPSGCPLWDLVCCFQPTKTDKVKFLEHSVCEGYFTSIYLRDLS